MNAPDGTFTGIALPVEDLRDRGLLGYAPTCCDRPKTLGCVVCINATKQYRLWCQQCQAGAGFMKNLTHKSLTTIGFGSHF
jgi:hypothetical protein